ncbi:hypothetical protein QTI66_00115 [Variovorax sp. J22R133]|uniref:hypothetical protein n=1 Tax=Variovorax brevis TaxID=3053503 RepID=UPI002576FDE9|nr:hypothetical protein [Variovorax sp. J22R133]MDM0110533.1 hypothetical protein [Variovorax sp. J22R133]
MGKRPIGNPVLAIALLGLPLVGEACCNIRIDPPRIEVPTVTEVVNTVTQAPANVAKEASKATETVTQAVNDAGKAVGQVATDASKEAGIGLGNVVRETQIGAGSVLKEVQKEAGDIAKEVQIGAGNVATTIRKAGSDVGQQANRSQHDLEDAGVAIYRYVINEALSTQSAMSNAEKRFREGKVVDAFFHLATEPIQNTEKNAAQAAMESSVLSTVGSVAASVYGGPAGAAAYAAWLTYHQTGDINMAIRVGIIAGASSWANGQAATMQTGTVTDSIQRAAVVGAIGGAAVAASGGDPNAINQAFLRGGAAILVQDGYKAYVDRDLLKELGPANGGAMCMAGGADDGCPRPTDYMKDEQGRLIMTDKDGGFHHVEIGKEGEVHSDWRAIGNASKTPPGTPVVGIQTDQLPALSQANEGSATMVALAKVPGMNAMALFHDRWAVSWEMNPATTVATIVPAIVLTYMGATLAVEQAYTTTGITDAARAKSNAAKAEPVPTVAAGQSPSAAPTTAPPPIQGLPAAMARVTRVSVVEGGRWIGPPPPTIRAIKPAQANMETLLCSKGTAFRVAAVIPGKQPGDLQCLVYEKTDAREWAPYVSKNTPAYCAEKLVAMGTSLSRAGWKCNAR